MKNITITGSSGFVGTNLQVYLNQFSINSIALSRGENLGYLDSYKNNIANNSFDAFIHLAGKAHDLKKTVNDSEYFDVNAELTKTLYSAFLQSDTKTFIFISSVKAAADSIDGILDESYPPNPITAYGKSKLQAEEFIFSNLPDNKRVYILRPCLIHGPGNKGNLNLSYKLVSKGLPWPLGSFENKRSYCSIENLCFVIKELINRTDIPSGLYNVADDDTLSTNQLIALIAKTLNKKPYILHVPKTFVHFLSRIGNLLKLPLNIERLQKLTESYVVSNEKIKSALGKPFPSSAEYGLLKTFHSFK
jgi:nucleoside-diphosphate-sugar epimerase